MSLRSTSPFGFGALASLVLLSACASTPPEPVTIEDTETVTATVEAIDVNTRMVALRGPEGEQFTVQAAPEIQNLAQVKVGDKVVARYYESLVAELRNRGDKSGETDAPASEAAIGRAAPGAKPGVAAGRQVSQSVRITAIDNKNHVVSFYGSDGLARSAPVRTPEGQAFLSKLKVGDEVELTYTEAVALSVEPAK
jgi:hypothetical protein